MTIVKTGHYKRNVETYWYRNQLGMIGQSGVDKGLHDGDPVEQEMAALGLAGLLMDTDADMVNMLTQIPRDFDWTQEMGVRVLYQTASADATDWIDWLVKFAIITPGVDALIVGATALDTAIARDTVAGTAQVLEKSPRGVIDGETITPQQVYDSEYISWNIEMDDFDTDLAEDKLFLGLRIDYFRKPQLGSARNDAPDNQVTDEFYRS